MTVSETTLPGFDEDNEDLNPANGSLKLSSLYNPGYALKNPRKTGDSRKTGKTGDRKTGDRCENP